MARKVAIPKGTTVLTCGHPSLRHVLRNKHEPEGENIAFLCDACFAVYLQDGSFDIPRTPHVTEEDIFEASPTDWS